MMAVRFHENNVRNDSKVLRRPFSMSVLIHELLFTHRDYKLHKRINPTFGRFPPRRLARLQGLSLQGPPADQDTLRRYNSEYVIREDKHSEHLIQSSRKLRSSWSNITSGSIISRKNKHHVINGDTTDNLQDVRFFAELVKPLQYRLRTHEKEEKEKILFPSKYGFHQRSHSPTFRRLLEATEKLKIISQHETVKTLLKQNANINEKKVVPLIKPDPEIVKEKAELFDSATPKTPDVTARTEKKKHTTFITDEVIDNKDNTTISDFPDNITTISEEPEVEDVSDIDSEDEDDEKEDHDNSFKVDFKVDDSHAELHLFLPKISSGNKSAKTNRTDDFDESSNKTDRTGPIVLPSIKVDSIHQIKSYQNPPGRKLKRQETFRKKKKKAVERIKSAADPDKKVRDHLNDVHTLISIEDHHSSHTNDTVCHFENCPYHSLLPQTQESTL